MQQTYPDTDPLDGEETGSGKSVVFTYEYVEDRHVHGKEILDVVTDDGCVYSWSRFREDEPYTFECRYRSDGRPDSARRQLPKAVSQVIEDHDERVIY